MLIKICLIVALLMGCSTTTSPVQEWMRPNGKVKVLSTTAMIDNIVTRIGKERIDHIALIVGEIDPHSYELVKGDDEKLCFAGAIFYNGLGLEHGASLRYALAHHPKAVNVGEAIQHGAPDSIIYTDGQVDPHIWMDIFLWSAIVDPIAETLAALDPEGKAFYARNAAELKAKMQEEHDALRSGLAVIPASRRYLVTSHGAFNYFARAYLATQDEDAWRLRAEAPEGLAPEGQLSIAHIQSIVDHLIRYQIPVVFPESNVSPDSLNKIRHACRQKGLEVKVSTQHLYADAMGGNGAEDYFQMMRTNAAALINAWSAHE
jgi:manganese/zinc/iron transport system substrate-binding protein